MKDVLSLQCPLFSHPPSPGVSVCYLEIWNDEQKVKTCIIGSTKRIFYLWGNIQIVCIVFWHFEMGTSLGFSLMIFSGAEILLCLQAFSFLDSQGVKKLPRLQQAVMTWCDQLLLKDKYCAGWGTGQGNSWWKKCWLFPDFPLHSSSIACPRLYRSTPHVSVKCQPSGLYKQTLAGHAPLSLHPESEWLWTGAARVEIHPFTLWATQTGTLLPCRALGAALWWPSGSKNPRKKKGRRCCLEVVS